jgi:BCD family chlorophyll transporter-like MFS transporter
VALWGLEGLFHSHCVRVQPWEPQAAPHSAKHWTRCGASPPRRFTIFVFVSMLAYSAQDLILEPFAGTVFGFTPGESTQLSGVQHGGVLLGMLLVALAGQRVSAGGHFPVLCLGSLRGWTIGGCLASALALFGPGWWGGAGGSGLAAARQRCLRWAWPTARFRSPPSVR